MSKTNGHARSLIVPGLCLLFVFLLTPLAITQTKPVDTSGNPQKPVAPSSVAGLEFPVRLRQNVTAGKTAVGSKVQAALTVATFVKGVVIPEGAIFSGQVIESAAKSATNPSRLAVRMDSAQWKNKGSGTLVSVELDPRVYLSSWYYPPVLPKEGDHDRPIGIADASHNPTMPSDPSGGGRNQRNPAAPPLPTPDDETLPPRQSADTQNHRVQLKSVQSMRNDDGILVLTSDHSNIKLDKTLTYVLATRDFGGVK
jgi:hypothetical protein